MKIIIRIGTLIIALVFLLGSTGISFYHHTCFSSNTQKTTVYPGIFKPAVSCCCGSTSDSDGNSGGDSSIDVASCCKSVTSVIKLRPGYLPATNSIFFAPETTILAIVLNPTLSTEDMPGIQTYRFFEFYSPPFTGKALVHFLHQLKVPSDPSIA